MKTSRDLALATLLAIVTFLLIGWLTSTRHVDIQLLKEGEPLSSGALEVVGAKEGLEPELFSIAEDGWVRLPSSYVKKTGVCKIMNEDFFHDFVMPSFSRGKLVMNFTSTGTETEHSYRFLIYERQMETKPMPVKPEGITEDTLFHEELSEETIQEHKEIEEMSKAEVSFADLYPLIKANKGDAIMLNSYTVYPHILSVREEGDKQIFTTLVAFRITGEPSAKWTYYLDVTMSNNETHLSRLSFRTFDLDIQSFQPEYVFVLGADFELVRHEMVYPNPEINPEDSTKTIEPQEK